ncbi:MAG TPA: glycosyltransferase family 4 protein [Gemmatimonadales bacterium]|jgi:glycosyltransferase involved in cell wall biosynthesis|nr:glycosyltransferase family 4 protein [Gemmatimonadales bacterium]
MRVLHIVTAFPRTSDDVITPWLVELIKRQGAAGHEVEVLTSSYRGLGDHVFDGIPVHRFRYFFRRWENLTHEETAPDRMRRSLLYRIMPAFYILAGMIAAWRLNRRQRYDVLHVHWPLPLALFGWAAQAGAAATPPPPVVTTFYGVELRWVKRSMPFLKRFLAWAARRSARVVAISSYTAAELRELAPDIPIAVIPYTTSLPEPSPSQASVDGPPAVLFVGRLVERKGVRYLLEAMAALRDRPVRLVVIGDGAERARLEAAARELGVADRVEFRGRISAADLQDAYANAVAFVLPAVVDARGDTEGLGVVILEAMSYGTPVIASRIGGITDIVEDGRSGLLVPPGDAGALAAALRRLLEDRDLARRLGDAGRRRVREQFSWDAITARWEAVYRSLR